MAYSTEYYEYALKIIRDNKKTRQKEYEKRLSELYVNIPELKSIDIALSACGAKAMNAAMAGKTEELKKYEKESARLKAEKKEILSSVNISEPTAVCTECNDTGYKANALCNCVKRLAKELVYKDLSREMPIDNRRFENFSLEYYGESKNKMSQILSTVKAYAENFTASGENMLFLGGVGLGKTHLSMAVINTVTEKGYGVIYGSAQNLFSQIEKEHFAYNGQSSKSDALLNCDLLVIDDLGTEFSTSFTVAQFYNIVNTRINNGKSTIINTNLTLQEIEKNYTPRVLSRLVGNYKIMRFEGTDIRMQKAIKCKQ